MNLELQSFLVAVIVGAIFVAERIGGSEEVLRRLFQVTLAFVLVFLTLAATTAFLRAAASPIDFSNIATLSEYGTGGSSDTSERAREAASIHVGVAILLVLAGLAAFQKYRTSGLSFALGGLLLLLTGGARNGDFATDYLNSLGGLFGTGGAGETRDIIYFVVLAIGSLLLLGYGYKRWDASEGSRKAASA